jgi:hypothetical protein
LLLAQLFGGDSGKREKCVTERGENATERAAERQEESIDDQILAALRAIPENRKQQVLRYLRFVSGEGARVPAEGRFRWSAEPR